MIHWSFWTFLLCLISQFEEAEPLRKISVMSSNEKQTGNHALQRLDSQIVKNFAQHFKFDIEYITINETLNEVFSTENRFDGFLHSIQHS